MRFEKKVMRLAFFLLFPCFFLFMERIGSAEAMILIPQWKLERLDEIFQEQENLINRLLSESDLSSKDFEKQKLELQALQIQIVNLQSEMNLAEEDLKKSSALLLRAEELLAVLEKKHQQTVHRLKRQRNTWVVLVFLSIGIMGGISGTR